MVPESRALAEHCERHRVPLLVDAYHHLNVVPFDIRGLGLERACVIGGGYKYCQLGEGNCFLRLPAGHELRPIITGWFSEFATLAAARRPGELRYGEGAARLAGATYDPTSHYRAASVFAFHEQQGLTPERLRSISQRQVRYSPRSSGRSTSIRASRRSSRCLPSVARGSWRSARPVRRRWSPRWRARSVFVDARGDVLRLGPAPYVSDEQLARSLLAQLREVARAHQP